MKVAINTEHCINGILKASSITPTKSGAAMLRTMWIRAEKDRQTISFMSTDASTEYIGIYPAEVEEDGLIGVQSKSITELLRSLPKGVIRMYTDDKGNNLVITQGSRTFKLPVSNLDWFQNFSEFPEDNSIVWSGEVLIGIIDRILFCVSDEEDSPLGCLYIRPKDNGEIDFCGLDGNKFALVKETNDPLHAKLPHEGILIQKKYLNDIKKLISEDEIELNFTGKRFFIRNNDKRDTVSIPLVQFEYPDYTLFLSKIEPDCSTLSVAKTEMSDALSRSLIFNTKDENSVFISLGEASLTLQSSDKSTGSATETIPATVNSTVKNVAFITRGLLDVLQHIDAESIEVKIASEAGPCLFRSVDDHSYVVIAMPVQIVEDTYYIEEDN